jgi:hypothetical protein
MNDAASFPTFCHINDHGIRAYRHLHRMVATSLPLNLWSPSSSYLKDPSCRLSPDEFVTLIEKGLVRVAGRERWLLDRGWRDRHPFPGAAWDPRLDGAIRDIALADLQLPEAQRRVLVAPDEVGLEKARQ